MVQRADAIAEARAERGERQLGPTQAKGKARAYGIADGRQRRSSRGGGRGGQDERGGGRGS
eukprot:5322649-Prymnesium_polylepis.1